MKYIRYIIAINIFFTFFACNDDEFLIEEPLDIYTADNSYNTSADIVSTLTEMYRLVKAEFDGSQDYTYMFHGTDVAMSPRNVNEQIGYRGGATITPDNERSQKMWDGMYLVIKNANLVLDKVEGVEYPSESLKIEHIAEARFFRGFAYRTLANMYGRVPLVLEVVNEVKRDYVRAESRDAVYQQSADDLDFASKNLPGIDQVDAAGRVSKAAAYHILSEVYISLKQFDKAITSAKWVIDNPNFELMTERFGRRTDVAETNVFWDLFQRGNVDWQSGNKETIWALQTAYGIPGGGNLSHSSDGNIKFERAFGPLYWFANDPDGVKAFFGPTTQNGGRPGGYISVVNHVKYGIWKDNWDNDIRNAPCNIKRDHIVDNPASAYFGQSLNAFKDQTDTLWHNLPYWMKLTTPGDHLPETIQNPETGELWASGGGTHKNWQHIRLAETYLLLAEAYLGNDDQNNAAIAINVIRNRAEALPVASGDVDIDYILDERLRELLFEDPRRMTLMRMGKWYERTTKYNTWSGPDKVEAHWELFPIPASQIERNTEAALGQNDNYLN
ncbi:RagB/SusD family nutrient uptake outer membrane protein [Reichenbachiella sp. MALMAid0571]|uniref:RagB/SusD family nutrient uptake outer membrane protein n=1 Tax=Reichenbachiella sp. MALMAid0571 TaxID=3143939 RepID=UPI0032DF4410